MYLRSCYYMAGWVSDFSETEIAAVKLLGEPVIIYRTGDGQFTALEDRCCHRAAPLSLGRREGDDVRCMYHGIRFGPDGACTELPGQPTIPKAVCVRAYPVTVKHGAVWVWMGDASKADPDLIPWFVGPDDTDWAVRVSCLDIDAEAQLVIDNLLDVSHAPYVHERTFASSNSRNVARMIQAEHEAKTSRLDRGVHIERWIVGREDNPFLGGIATDDFAFNAVSVPGIFTMRTNCYPTGTALAADKKAPETGSLMQRFVGQIITPVEKGKCKLFYASGVWKPHADLSDQFFSTVTTAFHEDELMIEAQQKVIDALPDRPMMALNMDGPLTRYEGIVRNLAKVDA